MKLKKKIIHNYKTYILSDFSEEEKKSILGDSYRPVDLSIQEILDDKLSKIITNRRDWFFKSVKLLEFYIESSFYNKQYDIDKASYFFYKIYNNDSLSKAMSYCSNDDECFDGIFDLYVLVLKELNYNL